MYIPICPSVACSPFLWQPNRGKNAIVKVQSVQYFPMTLTKNTQDFVTKWFRIILLIRTCGPSPQSVFFRLCRWLFEFPESHPLSKTHKEDKRKVKRPKKQTVHAWFGFEFCSEFQSRVGGGGGGVLHVTWNLYECSCSYTQSTAAHFTPDARRWSVCPVDPLTVAIMRNFGFWEREREKKDFWLCFMGFISQRVSHQMSSGVTCNFILPPQIDQSSFHALSSATPAELTNDDPASVISFYGPLSTLVLFTIRIGRANE